MKTESEYISIIVYPDHDGHPTDIDDWLERSLGMRGEKWTRYRPYDSGLRVVMVYEFKDERHKTLFDITWGSLYTVYSTPQEAREGYMRELNETVRRMTKGF